VCETRLLKEYLQQGTVVQIAAAVYILSLRSRVFQEFIEDAIKVILRKIWNQIPFPGVGFMYGVRAKRWPQICVMMFV